jgi:hypothetical protein
MLTNIAELFATAPINASQKAASPCWPAKDKTTDLTLVTSVQQEVGFVV